MRSVFRTLYLFGIMAIPFYSLAQSVDSNYEVATWQGFTVAAISYTFDDNCSNQYAVAIPAFDEAGFCGTFYPVMNWGPKWANFKEAAAKGHEIGSHTMTHPTLSNLDLGKQEEELKNSKDKVDAEIGADECETIAYPYCVPSNLDLTREYYIAARHCQGQINKSTPPDFYNISSIICGEAGSLKTTSNFKTNAENTAKIQGWSVYLIHGIDGDGGYSSLDSDVLKESLEFYNQNRERFWVVTFVNAVKYIRERNSVSVQEIENTSDVITVQVNDTLDNQVYNVPVTLRRPLPEGWSSAAVVQGEDSLQSEVVEISNFRYIEFDVVPDQGNVLISKVVKTSSSTIEGRSGIQINPNPFQHKLQIKSSGDFSYRIFSLNGQIMESGNRTQQGLVGEALTSGTYFLNVTNESGAHLQKIVKR